MSDLEKASFGSFHPVRGGLFAPVGEIWFKSRSCATTFYESRWIDAALFLLPIRINPPLTPFPRAFRLETAFRTKSPNPHRASQQIRPSLVFYDRIRHHNAALVSHCVQQFHQTRQTLCTEVLPQRHRADPQFLEILQDAGGIVSFGFQLLQGLVHRLDRLQKLNQFVHSLFVFLFIVGCPNLFQQDFGLIIAHVREAFAELLDEFLPGVLNQCMEQAVGVGTSQLLFQTAQILPLPLYPN